MSPPHHLLNLVFSTFLCETFLLHLHFLDVGDMFKIYMHLYFRGTSFILETLFSGPFKLRDWVRDGVEEVF